MLPRMVRIGFWEAISHQSKRYGRGKTTGQTTKQKRTSAHILAFVHCLGHILHSTKAYGDYRSMAFDTAAKWEKTCITFVCLWFAGQASSTEAGQQTRATKMQLAMSILWQLDLVTFHGRPTGMCKQNPILCVFLQNGM